MFLYLKHMLKNQNLLHYSKTFYLHFVCFATLQSSNLFVTNPREYLYCCTSKSVEPVTSLLKVITLSVVATASSGTAVLRKIKSLEVINT